MKAQLIRLAGGAGMAAAVALATSAGASASSNADCDHGQQESYNQTQSRNSSYNQGQRLEYRGGGYDNASGRGGGSIVSYAGYSNGSDNSYNNSNSYRNQTGPGGMLHNGNWYDYNQMGYWCNGQWMPYSSNWNSNDYQQWEAQGCL